jgi:hypothetical protein
MHMKRSDHALYKENPGLLWKQRKTRSSDGFSDRDQNLLFLEIKGIPGCKE